MIAKIKKKIKKKIISLTRPVGHLKRNVECPNKWYGGDYTGFYVCPNLLNNQSIVYSFGIGEDISFDKAIINSHKCKVFGFDPTPKSINWVNAQSTPVNFNFNNFGIGINTEDTLFYLPANKEHVSGSLKKHSNVTDKKSVKVHMKSFQDITSLLGHKKIDLLKMDIEGAEYDVIESILKSDVVIDQILIEFHDRFFDDKTPKSLKSVNLLRAKGYEIFAVSDSYEEISFIRKHVLKEVNSI
ncbi:FkbM family methyltransferase [Jejuia spongiicola]|uniref:FkbM family methyltransferase n=1 Tax=Jejuia spongiicola TaxID=2942207 RepID=A0ABT0Q8V9_9FLAO|nr:FkbM family methyltransferase [Jejuia spongiicola]MCL6293416.1 FkbM family methyltransferase [Jejuia spongiicola]